MKLRLIFTLTMMSFCLLSQGQNVDVIYEDDAAKTAFIEANFQGGFNGYTKYFQEKLRFPAKSFEAQVEGLLLFNFTINKAKGRATVQFLTLLDKDIEKQVRSVVQSSLPLWNIKDNNAHKFYQPIVYSMLPLYTDKLQGDIPELPLDLPAKFLQPFILVKSDRNAEKVAMASLSKVDVNDPKKTFYFGLQEAYDRFKKKGDKLSASRILTQIIRYNPLDKDYLIDRIKLEVARGTNRYQVYDSDLLTDFVDSKENRYKGRIKESSKSDQSKRKAAAQKTLIADYYEGGMEGFTYDFLRKLNYPEASRAQGTQGVALLKFSIPKEGVANATLLTKLDPEIDQMIMDAAEFTNSWERRETTYNQYIAFFFSVGDSFVSVFTDQIDTYKQLTQNKEDLMGMMFQGSSEPMAFSFKKEIAATEQLDLYNQYLNDKATYEKLAAKGKAKKIFPALTKLIRFNPFDKALIEERIRIAKAAKNESFVEMDKALLDALNEMQ